MIVYVILIAGTIFLQFVLQLLQLIFYLNALLKLTTIYLS